MALTRWNLNRKALLILGFIGLAGACFVALTLRRPEVPTFSPSPVRPVPVGERLVGPVAYTVDAADPDRWRFFRFDVGSVIEDPHEGGWDLAFRRFHIIVNGGRGFNGRGGIADLGSVPFESVTEVPETGYTPTEAGRDSVNQAIARWYDYGFFSHLLTPQPRVFAVRTRDGRFAKLEILSYYCTGARPGCITFRYAYQGDGSTRLVE